MPRSILYEAPRVAAKPGETVVTSTCGHFMQIALAR
jgi:hypothetical protein